MIQQDRVHTMTDYYDGPRGGVADFRGTPHVYHSLWADIDHDRSDVFELAPIDDSTLALAIAAWEIWRRWEVAFHRGETTLDTHPALPPERSEHERLSAALAPLLSVRSHAHTCATADFEWPTAGGPALGAPLRVTWTVVDRPVISETIDAVADA